MAVGKYFVVLFSLYLLSHEVNSKFVKGEIKTDTSNTNDVWRFVTRFCFISGGKFEYKLEYPEKYEIESLNLYYDEPDKWPEVYDSNMDCEKRTGLPYINVSAGHQITLAEYALGCERRNSKLICRGERGLISARQRWWFMAISRCKPDRVRDNVKGMVLDFELTMTNGNDLFFKHFSADEFYILQIDITFLLVTLVIVLITIVFMVKLMKKKLLHTTFKMFLTSVIFQFIYLLFMCITYGAYANDGIERYGLKTFARLWQVLSDMTFVLMLILMAKGYTITRGRLRKTSWIKICVFTAIYVFAYIILFLIEAELHDPAVVTYLYESSAGIALVILRACAWVWFLYANIFTIKHYPEKKKFYIPFLIFFTVWFLATPVVILIAAFAMEDWVRATVVNAIEVFIVLCGQIFFLVLTAPSSANKNFPYHVKSTKIGSMVHAPHHDEDHSPISDDDDDDSGNNNHRHHNGFPLATNGLERYSHDRPTASAPYTVSNAAPNFADLFITSQTHSENPRPYPPPYSPKYETANGGAVNGHGPPPVYSQYADAEKDTTKADGGHPERDERTTFSNDENPFITQR